MKITKNQVTMTVIELAELCRDWAWDYPSFVAFIELDSAYGDDEPPMHPTGTDSAILATALEVPAEERLQFISDFPLDWDT